MGTRAVGMGIMFIPVSLVSAHPLSCNRGAFVQLAYALMVAIAIICLVAPPLYVTEYHTQLPNCYYKIITTNRKLCDVKATKK